MSSDCSMTEIVPVAQRIARKMRAGARAAGFAGPGRTAIEAVCADALAATNPFVLLMDGTLDFRPGPSAISPGSIASSRMRHTYEWRPGAEVSGC